MARFELTVDQGEAPLVPFLEEYALPERFTATATPDEPDLPICHLALVVESGRVTCEGLQLERRADGPALGRALLGRIPVAEYVSRAVDNIGYSRWPGRGPVSVTSEGETYPLPTEPAGEGYVATRLGGISYTPAYKAATRSPRHPGSVSEETLAEVADVYRRAHAKGAGPTKAVMDEWDISRSTASRWVKRAREAGALGAAQPRVAGEAPQS